MEMPPFAFETLEAALCSAAPGAGAGGGGDGPNGGPGGGGSADGGGEGPLDVEAAAAAGLLLRDVHLALLRCLDGTLHKPGPKCPPQPLSARYVVKTGHGIVVSTQHWSQRAAATVHSFAAEVVDGAAATAAALELYQSDYCHLSFDQRAALLRALAELALASEALREHVGARIDAPTTALKAGRPRLLPPAGGGGDADEAAARGPAPAQALAWVEWCDAQRLGVRRPLGVDISGRRYWALGGAAGAWRVYVEGGPGGGDWGWYEGPALAALAKWIAAGNVECEAPLLRALGSMPWPLRPGARATGGGAGGGAGRAAAQLAQLLPTLPPDGAMMGAAEMRAARVEGYRTLTGPLVYGELNFPNGVVVPTGAGRLAMGMTSLLGLLPFWRRGPAGQAELGALLERVKAATAPDELSDCLLATESALCQSELMPPDWAPRWRAAWRAGLAQGGPARAGGARAVGRHLGALSRAVVLPDHTWPRDAFMRVVETYRCPLIFPPAGSSIVLLRAGVKLHLQRYAGLRDEAARGEVGALLQRVEGLPPIKEFVVAAATYRAYPSEAGSDEEEEDERVKLEQQQQQEQQRRREEEEDEEEADERRENGQQGAEGQEEGQQQQQAPGGQRAGTPPPPTARPPCMWMLLTPARADGTPRPGAGGGDVGGEIALPIHIDPSLPDFLMPAQMFAERTKKTWTPGERFRMYFGGKHGTKARFARAPNVGGAYYKGNIVAVATADNHTGPGDFDPWESITVHWDNEENSVNKGGLPRGGSAWRAPVPVSC
ncbi:hypothetical protein MNEG_14891 [Monoraphidium neglectum]|uniref:WHIM1 domain-containing protein n=1 Tax=Monoraphidium neglectum TaxID=145388 RepID=A0A0D2IYX7_9CHLO|nr:hypothetical protein MNEG_14891 [Monoraphidium neglectum]KIY93072.1 hypothetical protein MNEG_14891 [Monoraphidium neglectum]|eukprot:XP_013892092.1 hypothetical protein MNEG_14891 [Monoraphidium neglectum]